MDYGYLFPIRNYNILYKKLIKFVIIITKRFQRPEKVQKIIDGLKLTKSVIIYKRNK